MADLRAFEAVSEGVFGILRSARSRVALDEQPEFKAITAPEMQQRPVTMGVTLMVHEIVPMSVLGSTTPVPPDPSNPNNTAPPSFEMRFLLSVWSNAGSVEQRLAAWVAESMLLHPVLTSEELNRSNPDCFGADETVSVMPLSMPFVDLMSLWTAIGGGRFRLSMPFAASGIRIRSE